MRRAAALLASRLPAGAALEAGQPSTSASVAVVAQWGRAFTSTAAARVPVHPEEELYNRQGAGVTASGLSTAAVRWGAQCDPADPPADHAPLLQAAAVHCAGQPRAHRSTRHLGGA